MNRFIMFLTAILFAHVVAATTAVADGPATHKIWLEGSEAKNTFVAKIDGQKFATLASLEDYLATFPSGDHVRCRADGGKVFVENPDLPSLRQNIRLLKQFCLDHQLDFIGSISFL